MATAASVASEVFSRPRGLLRSFLCACDFPLVVAIRTEAELAVAAPVVGGLDEHRSIRAAEWTPDVDGMIRKMSITGVDNSITEVAVYSGDEHYRITADTFSSFDSRPAINQ